MRTLKKTLALVLVLAMMFSLCVTASAANYDDYTDADTVGEAYAEAVDTMMGVGIIDGMSDTEVGATATLTREQGAKIISYLKLGAKAADALSADAAPFADVAADRWSAGYIAYCANEGILDGYGDGNFGPKDELTGYAFGKMLLTAVGYGVNEEYVGAGWSIAVARDGLKKGVYTGDVTAATNDPIQRQQAILMAFNTLTAIPTVKWSSLMNDYVLTGSNALGISVDPTYLAGNFKLNAEEVVSGGYNGHVWIIGTTMKADLSNVVSDWYMDDVVLGTEDAIANLTKGELYKAYEANTNVDVYVNGDFYASVPSSDYIQRGSNVKPLEAYAGAVADFVDEDYDGVVDKVMITIEYLAKVNKVNKETPAASASVDLTVYNGYLGSNVTTNVSADDYDIDGLAKDDYVVIIPGGNTNADFAVPASMVKAEPVIASVDSYVTNKTVTLGETTYGYAGAMKLGVKTYDFAPASYAFYLSSTGYVLGNEVYVPGATPLNYIWVSQVEGATEGTSLIVAGADALKVKGTTMDGTTKVYDYVIKTCTTNDLPESGFVVGDKYITYNDGTANVNVKLADLQGDQEGKALSDGLYSYTLDDAGAITLSKKTTVTVGLTTYTAQVINSTGAYISTAAGDAGMDISGKYATGDTTLVVVNAAGAATTYNGYSNFPGTATNRQQYTIGTGAGKCATIVAVYANNLVVDVLVIGNVAETVVAKDILAYTGKSYTAPNAVGASTVYYTFTTIAGETVNYPIDSSLSASDAGKIYAATITNGVASIVEVTDGAVATGLAAVVGEVTEVTDTYIVVDGKIVYLVEAPVYLKNAVTNLYAADSFVDGDTATVIYSTVPATADQMTVGFISTGASTR